MTSRTAVLFHLALILLFGGYQLWLFSLIDRSTDQFSNRMVMRDAKTGSVVYQCYSPPKRSKR